MKPATAKVTYDHYRLMDDGKRYELIDGELLEMTPAPTPRHQQVLGRIYLALSTHVSGGKLGVVYLSPIDVVLDEYTVVQPDILFVSQGRRDIVREDAIHGAPDLVIEILSPSSFYHDLRRKLRIYGHFGVQEYWIVDPEKQSVEQHKLVKGTLELARRLSTADTLESALLAGFALRVQEIYS
jgi:Uma2 family endonuclease